MVRNVFHDAFVVVLQVFLELQHDVISDHVSTVPLDEGVTFFVMVNQCAILVDFYCARVVSRPLHNTVTS